ncbi:MAG: glycoside hydrolase family 28 protein [Pelobium sp.]
MNKRIVGSLIAILLVQIFFSCTQEKSGLILTKVKVDAPFDMPELIIPNFDKCKEFLITDFGAKNGDKEKNTKAIEIAIDKANKAGGGKVIVPKGEWLTGKIHFKSNVDLHLNEGSVLLFSEKPEDYLPAVLSSWEGMECYNYSPLIYAYECKNIAITGKGELKAKLDVWEIWYARPPAHLEGLKKLYYDVAYHKPVKERQMTKDSANFRPQFIQFNRCENVLLEGVKITNSPFWTIHPYLSKSVVIRNINVYAHGHNNDGVDPEMSQNMLIENCVFDQGDDAIAVKSGKNQDGWRLNTPSKNIVIRNCMVKNGHQLLAIGSELSGGIENVFIKDCVVADDAKLNNLLYIKTNERRGGYVKNIYLKDVKCGNIAEGILGIETDVMYQMRDLVKTVEIKLTPISDIYLDGLTAKSIKFVSGIQGQEELPVKNVFLKNIKVDTIRESRIINSNVLNFKDEN